jgi:hypothetical protein
MFSIVAAGLVLIITIVVKEFCEFKHILNAAEEHWRTIMDFRWHHIQYASGSCCAHTSSLLHNKSHGGAFIQKSQLAFWVLASARVSINTSIDENVMDIRYQSANVSGCDAEINTIQKLGRLGSNAIKIGTSSLTPSLC